MLRLQFEATKPGSIAESNSPTMEHPGSQIWNESPLRTIGNCEGVALQYAVCSSDDLTLGKSGRVWWVAPSRITVAPDQNGVYQTGSELE